MCISRSSSYSCSRIWEHFILRMLSVPILNCERYLEVKKKHFWEKKFVMMLHVVLHPLKVYSMWMSIVDILYSGMVKSLFKTINGSPLVYIFSYFYMWCELTLSPLYMRMSFWKGLCCVACVSHDICLLWILHLLYISISFFTV